MPPLAPGWAFYLDVDGTLLDHVDHPQAVRVEPGLLRLLRDLLDASDGSVALISGRSVAEIDILFAPLVFPAAGQHGTELRSSSGVRRLHRPPVKHLGRAAAEIVRLTAAHDGLVFENKGMTLALHYRMAPRLREVAESEMRRIAAALGEQFELQAGKFVYEIKPSGRNKGTAIVELGAEAPFAGRVPVFIGDDQTDEYGFDVVNGMGGHSVKVGFGVTRARWRLNDAASVQNWLSEYVSRFGGKRAARTAT